MNSEAKNLHRISRAAIFILAVFLGPAAWGFIHESVRIKALGSEFNGLIPDPYTDVSRNPAFLAGWGKGALTAEVLDAEKSIYGGNLAVSLKYLKFGISYKVHGNLSGFTPDDGRDFSGQRVASDLDGIPNGIAGLKKFQIVRIIGAKDIGKTSIGIDAQYLRDWTAAGSHFSTPSYNQLPTAFQIRTGFVFPIRPNWSTDMVLRYQRNRPRLEAGSRISYGATELDSSNSASPFISFGGRPTATWNASGRMNEWGFFLSSRFTPEEGVRASVVLSAERNKGDIPIIMGASDIDESIQNVVYRRSFSVLNTNLIQHYQWRYRSGFALSKSFPSGTSAFGGAVITVIRTREFYRFQTDSSVTFQKNSTVLQSRTNSAVETGEQNKSYFTEISIPTAFEIKPKQNVQLRLGLKPFLVIDNPDIDGHTADLNTFYTLGFGVELEKHIVVDAFAQKDLGNLQNWQIALRYLF
jgi:hypothetical protein